MEAPGQYERVTSRASGVLLILWKVCTKESDNQAALHDAPKGFRLLLSKMQNEIDLYHCLGSKQDFSELSHVDLPTPGLFSGLSIQKSAKPHDRLPMWIICSTI